MTVDDYVHVTAVARHATKGAVLLDDGKVEAWVPRSCLHGADDLFLNKPVEDGDEEEREWRIRLWQAKLKGFV